MSQSVLLAQPGTRLGHAPAVGSRTNIKKALSSLRVIVRACKVGASTRDRCAWERDLGWLGRVARIGC
jgi:hypothetical protein